MTVKAPDPPPLPSELDRLLRRLRLPYIRRAAPEVIATAAAQRWEHGDVGMLPSHPTPPRRSFASSTPPTRNARSR